MLKKLFGKSAGQAAQNKEHNLQRIFPIIKAQLGGGTSAGLENISQPISEHLVDNLHIYFAEDTGSQFEYLNEESLKDLQKNIAQIKEIALANLENYANKTGISIEGDDNLQMVKLDRNLEASLILMESLWSQVLAKYNDNAIVAIPSRELLIIGPASNSTSLSQLTQGANDLFNSGEYKLSPKVFLKRPGAKIELQG
ncbi:DUF1444 family protein [Paracrocinitomix mangrovi]|uniref:DUF1444 family protein n=1 Tax=Paracrocinitomix mangrovi TaxID=2862509 RepID=UPI001C8E7E45|nr:DUF1444 family protein [Paracrocinitomix mangrovi]UKN03800.1 DUF1444 family protein [Paracrocinitomix mangrovi]